MMDMFAFRYVYIPTGSQKLMHGHFSLNPGFNLDNCDNIHFKMLRLLYQWSLLKSFVAYLCVYSSLLVVTYTRNRTFDF